MKPIGITTTVPTEVLLAAGYQPVDLNNIFISDKAPDRLVRMAENAGFPQTCCTWIKGIYGACLDRGIRDVICVTSGDCSNTLMLMEVFKLKGLNVMRFAYPEEPDPDQMWHRLLKLSERLGTTVETAEEVREKLARCRDLLRQLDELTWREGLVSGFENHLWLVSSSDLGGDQSTFERDLQRFLDEARARSPRTEDIRLAYAGVPPVYARDLHRVVEERGARIVFNEIQRQFSMPFGARSLCEQYSAYTYPYGMAERLADIIPELKRRRVDGLIHYVQAFCHRGIGDIIIRSAVDLPVLTIEGNTDYVLTPNLQTKIEAFLDMLRHRRRRSLRVGELMKGCSYGLSA